MCDWGARYKKRARRRRKTTDAERQRQCYVQGRWGKRCRSRCRGRADDMPTSQRIDELLRWREVMAGEAAALTARRLGDSAARLLGPSRQSATGWRPRGCKEGATRRLRSLRLAGIQHSQAFHLHHHCSKEFRRPRPSLAPLVFLLFCCRPSFAFRPPLPTEHGVLPYYSL